jgi:hypothetical protein
VIRVAPERFAAIDPHRLDAPEAFQNGSPGVSARNARAPPGRQKFGFGEAPGQDARNRYQGCATGHYERRERVIDAYFDLADAILAVGRSSDRLGRPTAGTPDPHDGHDQHVIPRDLLADGGAYEDVADRDQGENDGDGQYGA